MTENPYGSPHSSDQRPNAEHGGKGAGKVLVALGVGAVIVFFLFLMLIPATRGVSGRGARRSACVNNLPAADS